MRLLFICFVIIVSEMCITTLYAQSQLNKRQRQNFCSDWKFYLGDVKEGQSPDLNDASWRKLNLPHDWSIEGSFSKDNPATPGGGALPGGIGWYRKSFSLPQDENGKRFYIEFDGVYRNSEVWTNGHYLGKRPYGYSSFRYELTPYLTFGTRKNIISVKVDNSKQPNSRWYSGSGIYRNVWLLSTGKIAVAHWGTYVTTSQVNEQSAKITVRTKIVNGNSSVQNVKLSTILLNALGNTVGQTESVVRVLQKKTDEVTQEILIKNPSLWSFENPYLYRVVSKLEENGKVVDDYVTTIGIRSFTFDVDKGFILNGKQIKINGVCNHHDLGCLGAAINTSALKRQLTLMKVMGVNGIRTSHNPPAPELLDLCDQMGILVMDEAFDMWTKKKTDFDYSLDWDAWHKKDLEDMVFRDRNHPSIFIWSIGNEVMEQNNTQNSKGVIIAQELAGIIRNLDLTRPITSACNVTDSLNPVIRSGALDLIGYNYHINQFPSIQSTYPGKPFIATETVSSLTTRGHYDMPSDSIRRWPTPGDHPSLYGNPDNSCSAYDNCSTPWGSTHEETWKIIKKYNFISGQFIWTGMDYLGEPTPYSWPSRSSYFGIVDLAGFPKDVYYMYKSEWTNTPVLHVFPHWNWKQGEIRDVWAYTNCEEVELFLNGVSLGTKKKAGDDLHLMWRIPFSPGELKAIARTGGKEILTQTIRTADDAAKIILEAEKMEVKADGKELFFITAKVVDKNGVIVPTADNLIKFEISGPANIVGTDNGCQTDVEVFISTKRKAFNGKCLAIIKAGEISGEVVLTAFSENFQDVVLKLQTVK
jgi:beta-galactosidase